ncbi:ectoine synthase [uncultured Ruegeria sp.]|uniref:ectoine synthase n=1 Tax=uncultured Ruegeria sp. TaxID=259304 RepID=UPI0034422D6A
MAQATDADLRFVCVFTPPLNGREAHRNDGSYALPFVIGCPNVQNEYGSHFPFDFNAIFFEMINAGCY